MAVALPVRVADLMRVAAAVLARVVEQRGAWITIGAYTIDADGMHFHLGRTKKGAEGGETLFAPAGFVKATCPVVAVRRVEVFLKAVGAYRAGAPLFPRVRERDLARGIVGVGDTPCGAGAFLRALKYYARVAGVSTERLGTHSLRRGHAHEAVRRGAELGDLQRTLRHDQMETTLGYADEVGRVLRHTGTLLGL